MIQSGQSSGVLSVTKTKKYLLYRISGNALRPLRFDLINLDGRKVRSADLLYGTEFIIPIESLPSGEYLYALNASSGLLQTGVVAL